MKTIVITKRTDDYHASLADRKGVWGCGRGIQEAIGDLVLAHPEQFDLKIERDDLPARPAAAAQGGE